MYLALDTVALPRYALGLEIAIPVIVVAVLLQVVVAKRRGVPALGGRINVRCSKGHVFETYWSSLGSFKAVRLGSARYQHCPVGRHWALVRPIDDGS